MRKITKMIISALGSMIILSGAAYADVRIDSFFGDGTTLETGADKHNLLHFSGSADGKQSNRIASIFIMKPGKTLADSDKAENIVHMDSVSVDFNGKFDFTLNFENESGIYPVFVVCGEETYTHNYSFKAWEEIKDMFAKIRDKSITFDYFKDYADVFGIDMSIITKDGHKDTFIKRICAKGSKITDDDNGVAAVKQALGDCLKEFEYLEEIKTAKNWADIPSIIEKIGKLTGISYDYKGKSQQKVCQALIDKEFTSAETLLTAFETAVDNADRTVDYVGGGGTTGGGSTGNYSGNLNPGSVNTDNNDESNAFNDIDSVPWAIKPINYLYKKGIINGTGGGKFSPNDMVKREEAVKMIINSFGLYDESAKAVFDDLSENEWYYKYIASAKEKNIVNGISESLFGIGNNVTRQDIAVMIYNAAAASGNGFTVKKTDFSDFDRIADYAKEAVSYLAGGKVINGMTDGSFAPNEFATRAQAAKMIYALIAD